jgi:hypothetical protein
MLRIETHTANGRSDGFRLDGQIAGPWVDELRVACADAIRRGSVPLRLDLRGVTFIDAAGLALLRDLSDLVVITHASLFAAEQLRTAGAWTHAGRTVKP